MPEIEHIPIEPEGNDQPGFDTLAITKSNWLGWTLYLNNAEVQGLVSGGTALSTLIPEPGIRTVVQALLGGLAGLNKMGGNKGVTIFHTFLGSATVPLPGKRI